MTKKNLNIRPQSPVTNSNAHTPRGMGVIEGSISQYGWIGAPTIAADGETFDGSARLEVGAALGFEFEQPQIFEADGDRPVIVRSKGTQPIIHQRMDIPNATDPRALALGVIANRSAELNLSYDASVLAGLAEEGIDLSGLFFPHELANILEDAGTAILDANELWKGMPDYEQDDLGSWKHIAVHFVNQGDYEAFARLVSQTLTPQTKVIWYPVQANTSYIVNECADDEP